MSQQPTADPGGASSRTRWYVPALLVIAVVAAACAIFLYNWLSGWHWPVKVTASATVLPLNARIPQDLSLTAGKGSPVQWVVDSGYIRHLTVSGPDNGTAEIILPLPRSWCAAIAAKLDSKCNGSGQMTMPSPVTFDWSNHEEFGSTDGLKVVSASLNITQAMAKHGGLHMDVWANTKTRPSFCFSSPQSANKLTLYSGARSFSHRFSGNEPTVFCSSGVSVVIPSAPAFEFAGIGSFLLHAQASAASLHGFAGQLQLNPGGTTVSGDPSDVLVCSKKAACPLDATLGIGQRGPPLVVRSDAATSVITGDGQLVPSAWARKTAIFGPLLGGLVTALVVGPLTAFMQVLTDALKNWRPRPFPQVLKDALKNLWGLFGRRFRKVRKDKEVHHAP